MLLSCFLAPLNESGPPYIKGVFGVPPLHHSARGAGGAAVQNCGASKLELHRSLNSGEPVDCRTALKHDNCLMLCDKTWSSDHKLITFHHRMLVVKVGCSISNGFSGIDSSK